MEYSITAKELLKELGGVDNIQSVTHCMTRLRCVLKDESGVQDERVKAIKGVMGVNKKGGQYQVIIGNDVNVCYSEFMKLGNFSGSASGNTLQNKEKITISLFLNRIVDVISGSIAPILPAIIGCGMLRLVVTILDLLHVSPELPTYQLLAAIGDAGFYFLPIILAASAAKKFECSQALAMTLAAVLVHPNLIALFAEGNSSFLRIPVLSATYSSSVIPTLLIAWILGKVEPFLNKYMKGG